MNNTSTDGTLPIIIGFLIALAIVIGTIVIIVKMIQAARHPQQVSVPVQLNKTGKFALWFGIFQIVVIPIFYLLYKIDPELTAQEALVATAIVAVYQLVIATVLIINGNKLRAITPANVDQAKKPLNWLFGVVFVGLGFAVVGMMMGEGGGAGLLLVFFVASLVKSRTALNRPVQPGPDAALPAMAPSTPSADPSAPPAPPTPPAA